MAIINARSPYYVSVTNASISYAILDISIWSGSSGTIATENTSYSLRKSVISTGTSVSFEIAELIKDDLDLSFDGEYPSESAYGDAKWVKTTITAYDSSNVVLGSPIVSTKIALDSYGYFEEGSSFTLAGESLLSSEGDIFLPKFGDSNIAVYTGNSPFVSLIDNTGATVSTSAFFPSIQSAEQVKYISLFPELITNLGFDDASSWSKQSEDSIEDGLLKFGGQSGSRYPSAFIPATGTNYILTFTITDYTSGSLSVYDGGSGANLSGTINKAGTYTLKYTQTATAGNLVSFYVASSFIGSMDNVSVKKVYDVTKVKVENSTAINTYRQRVDDDNGIFENSNCLYIALDFNELTRNRNVIQAEECKFEPHKVTFINKNGVLDDMYFFKKVTDNLITKRDTYSSNIIKSDNTYNTSHHSVRDFNITANGSVRLSSGFLNESVNEKFTQLLLSEKVWITKTFKNSELVLPINIKTSDITYKTSLNDKLSQYSIEFNDSYNAINNIR